MDTMHSFHAMSTYGNLCGSWDSLGAVWADLKADEDWDGHVAGVFEADEAGHIVRSWSA